jgi:uncharacterized protein YgiM (DUF1202 family)
MVPLEQLAAIYTAAGLPVPTPVAPSAAPPLDGSTALTGTDGTPGEGLAGLTGLLSPTLSLTGTAPAITPNGVIPTEPFTNALPSVGAALTVSDTQGVNARPAPSTEGDPLLTVPNGAVLPVLGRNAAGDWLQVQLPDGSRAWMFAEAVIASPDAATLGVVESAAPTVPLTGTAPLTDTAPITDTAAVPQGAPTGATATVTNPLGANLRSAPSRALDPIYSAAQGESFAVIGRNGDSLWVQIVLPDGTAAWALAGTVELSVGVETLPVTQP